MNKEPKTNVTLVAVIGCIVLILILVGGSIWMARSARKDTEDAARSVSLLYLDELAGRREQVVENNLQHNINVTQMGTVRLFNLMMYNYSITGDSEYQIADPEYIMKW